MIAQVAEGVDVVGVDGECALIHGLGARNVLLVALEPHSLGEEVVGVAICGGSTLRCGGRR